MSCWPSPPRPRRRPTDADPRLDSGASAAALTQPLVVMTRNMYVGTDVDRVMLALAGAIPVTPEQALREAVDTLRTTHLPTRIQAMVEEIARARPHVIALQEVSTISVPSAGYEVDFLPALLEGLAQRGLCYTPSSTLNFDIQGIAGAGIRLADRDVILIDSRIAILQATGATFTCGLADLATSPGVPVPGAGMLQRGWVRVDVQRDGWPVTLVNTHLESGHTHPIQLLRAAQARELTTLLTGVTHPVLLMGDLNDTPGSAMHTVLTSAGFTDLWAALRPGDPGYTCCHAPHLRATGLSRRIDYIMVRGASRTGNAPGLPAADVALIGDRPEDRTPGPTGALWPSDHAGLVAMLPG